MGPARREQAGGDRGADPPGLGQASRQAAQVVQAERGHHQVEAGVTERQRDRVGRDRVPGGGQRVPGAAQHALGQVGRHHVARPRGQRGPAGHAGACPQVEHQAAGQRHRRGRHQRPGQLARTSARGRRPIRRPRRRNPPAGPPPARPGPARAGPARPESARQGSAQQGRRLYGFRLPPREFLVIAAECLLPAELDHGAQQAQGQLALPPGFGVDAAGLERLPVGRRSRPPSTEAGGGS